MRSYVTERTENDVECNVMLFLTARGWLLRRKNVGLFYTVDRRPQVIGKRGECDYYAVHPTLGYVEIEVKRPGAKPTPPQLEWMARMRHFGFRAIWVDGVAVLEDWYRREFRDDQRTAKTDAGGSAGNPAAAVDSAAATVGQRQRPRTVQAAGAGAGAAAEGRAKASGGKA